MIEDFNREEFLKSLRDELSALSEGIHPEKNPEAFLIVGQPGAGKTALASAIYSAYHKNIIFINGDTFREAHPRFDELCRQYGDEAVTHTQKFSGQMVESCIDVLSMRKFNLIIEGTLRTIEVPLKTQKLLKSRDYHIILAFLLVRPEISYLSTLKRYALLKKAGGFARLTARDHHDQVVHAIPNHLQTLYQMKIFDDIIILNRNQDILYQWSDSPDKDPGEIVRNEFGRPLLSEEKQYIERTFSPFVSVDIIREILKQK